MRNVYEINGKRVSKKEYDSCLEERFNAMAGALKEIRNLSIEDSAQAILIAMAVYEEGQQLYGREERP